MESERQQLSLVIVYSRRIYNLVKGGNQMRGGRLGGPGRGGFGGGTSSGIGGMGINPLVGLAGLGMFGMMFRSSNRNYVGHNKQTSTLKVTSPKGGENWIVESTQTITWNSDALSGNFKIELSRDSGATWNTIVDSTPFPGNQTWNVTGPASTQAKIRVSSLSNNEVSGTSAADFSISVMQEVL
jgi:hypothetical protein